MDDNFPIPVVEPMPSRVAICPIVEAVLHMTFDSIDTSWEVLPGMIYMAVKETFPIGPKSLPASNIPDQLRRIDQNLQRQPHIQFESGTEILQLGPKMLGLCFPVGYPGWKSVRQRLDDVIAAFDRMKVSPKIQRVGLRYINSFPREQIHLLRFGVTIDKRSVINPPTSISMLLSQDDFQARIQVHTQAKVTRGMHMGQKKAEDASVFDIDVSQAQKTPIALQDCPAVYERAHALEKRIFFGLLSDELLKSLKPEFQ